MDPMRGEFAEPTEHSEAKTDAREAQGGADIQPGSLHMFCKRSAESEDYISESYDIMDSFLNCGADRGVLIDALAAYIDALGGKPEFDPEEVKHLTWRNRP